MVTMTNAFLPGRQRWQAAAAVERVVALLFNKISAGSGGDLHVCVCIHILHTYKNILYIRVCVCVHERTP